MKIRVFRCLLSVVLGFASSAALAQGHHGWSVLTGRTVGANDTALHIQGGWPGISATLLHGVSPTVDLGGIFTFNYGVEGIVTDVEPGIKLQAVARVLLTDTGKLNVGFNFAPGPLFYFGRSYCGRFGCQSDTLVGLTLPLALVFGVPVSSAANVDFGFEIPFWVYFTQGGGAVIPILFGGGVEYFFERNLAVTFNMRMGPAIYSRGGADFDLQALMGLAVKL